MNSRDHGTRLVRALRRYVTDPLGHIRSSLDAVAKDALSVELLSNTEMRRYFPNSHLLEERVSRHDKVAGVTARLNADRP